jgi:Uma2 family endonuclease
MVAPRPLSDTEWLLLTTLSDGEVAPRTTIPDFEWRIIALLMNVLLRYRRRMGLEWYIAARLKVSMRNRIGCGRFDLGPDLLMAEADDHPRDSWQVEKEGKPPFFVLEVVTPDSGGRDTRDKPRLYEAMGVQEHLIFGPKRKRAPKLAGYHRTASGLWRPWHLDTDGQIHSKALGGLLFYVEEDETGTWLRARDPWGRRLLSDAEAAEEEASRAAEEEARADAEAARADAAEAELARLRALLEGREAGGSP